MTRIYESSRWLARRPRLLAVTAAASLALIVVVGPNYGDAQLADTVDEFARQVPAGHRWRYVIAVVADFIFCAAYALFAISITRRPKQWNWWAPSAMLGWIGGFVVALGGVADAVENTFVAVNVLEHDDTTQAWIDRMRHFGDLKLGLVVAGGLLVGVALAAAFINHYVWTRRVRIWIGLARAPYAAVIGLLVLAVVIGRSQAAVPYIEWLFIPVITLLALVASYLNRVVRLDRSPGQPGDGAQAQQSSPDEKGPFGAERAALAVIQLAFGGGLVWLGLRGHGLLTDAAFFVGIALVVMSLGAFVSELREHHRYREWRGPALLVVGLGLLVAVTGTPRTGTAIALLGGGLIVAEVACELFTRDYLFIDDHSRRPRLAHRSVSAVGTIVVAVGISLTIAEGADPAHVLPGVAVLTVLVWFAMSDGDALVVVFLTAIVLVWATAPTGVEPDNERVPIADDRYFLVLGDSYTSGEGGTTFFNGTNDVDTGERDNDRRTNECRRSPNAWAFELAARAAEGRAARLPSRVMFHACSGAVTENIHTQPREGTDGRRHGPAELNDFAADARRLGTTDSPKPPELVFVGIGGNDAGFGTVAEACVGPGNCAEVRDQFLTGVPGVEPYPDQPVGGTPGPGPVEPLSDIGDDLDAAFARTMKAVETMKTSDGQPVPVIAVGYPNPIALGGRCAGVVLHDDERRFIRNFVRALNNEVRDAAGRQGLEFMDIEDALSEEGAQLCSGGPNSAGLNFFALNTKSGSIRASLTPTNWIHNSLHPNDDGHAVIARTAARWLNCRAESKTGSAACNRRREVELAEPAAVQCDTQSRPSCRVRGRRWLIAQAHTVYSTALFPLIVTVSGLWLVLAPVVYWRWRTRPSSWHLGGAIRDAARGPHPRASRIWNWLGHHDPS